MAIKVENIVRMLVLIPDNHYLTYINLIFYFIFIKFTSTTATIFIIYLHSFIHIPPQYTSPGYVKFPVFPSPIGPLAVSVLVPLFIRTTFPCFSYSYHEDGSSICLRNVCEYQHRENLRFHDSILRQLPISA